MKNKDVGRKWMWWFLLALVLLQIYFVRELLAAFALFAFGFAVLAVAVTGLYLVQRVWEAGLAQAEQHSGPVLSLARRGFAFVEEVAKKPFARPGSEPAQ
jgi:hypothetical protein